MEKIGILIDKPRMSAALEGKLLYGFDQSIVDEKCRRAGFLPEQIEIVAIENDKRPQDCVSYLNTLDLNTIIALDEKSLRYTTDKQSIWKWHLSPLDTMPAFQCRKVIPSFHPDQIKKEWHLNLYLEMALLKAYKHLDHREWQRKRTNYLLDPSYDEAIATLEAIRHNDWHSLDIETGYSYVNTFGIAWTPNDAIAIKILPDGLPTAAHHHLWKLIAEICESDSKKIMQNGIYERTYLSRYGIHINNFWHDTMCGMKFLYPELEKGLDNVGRIYTMEPYWKDDGRVASEEGKQKDWGNIRDWPRHLDYNCKDTTNTAIAAFSQREDLAARGLLDLYDGYIRRLFDCVYEMGAIGLPLNTEKQKILTTEYEKKSAELCKDLSQEINPRSSKQKLKLFEDKGYKIPIKRKTKKPSVDELSLKQMRLKHPDDKDIKLLLQIAGIEKALSSYLRVKTFDDNRIRFTLDPHGTETGRFACHKDPWDNGFNAQTMTDYIKGMIEFSPESGRVFVEVDLRQAETRFVAYDAVEETLLGMLERDEDIHSYVAAEIYNCSMAEIIADSKRKDIPKDQTKRQLGKKSGHGANYNMGVTTFMDSCLKELDLVLDRKMATRVLDSYHKLFPGIRRWHSQIRNTIFRERRLTNPLGRERYFYGRPDDNTFREGYAYRPQSTVPDIVNHMMLKAVDKRLEGDLDFWLHLQCHDSLVFSCPESKAMKLAQFCHKTDLWHPEIILPAGRLVIPTEVKVGRCLGELTEIKN